MNSFVALVCLAVLAVANAGTKYEVMDTQVELVKGGKCDDWCNVKMKGGLAAISGILNTVLTNLSFKNKFCDVSVLGLGNFQPEHECFANEDNTIHDHKVKFTFKQANATLACLLSTNPATAAEKINSAEMPTGKQCGDGAEDKLEKQAIKCDDNGDGPEEKALKVFADLKEMVLDIVIRVDSRQEEKVYPLSISFDLKDKNPAQKVSGEGFDPVLDCVFKDDNIKALFRNIFANAFKTVFDCLDEKNEQPKSLFGPIIFFAGNCKKN